MEPKEFQEIIFDEYYYHTNSFYGSNCYDSTSKEYAEKLIEATSPMPLVKFFDANFFIDYNLFLGVFISIIGFLVFGAMGKIAAYLVALPIIWLVFSLLLKKKKLPDTLGAFIQTKGHSSRLSLPARRRVKKIEEALLTLHQYYISTDQKIPEPLADMAHIIQNLDVTVPIENYIVQLDNPNWKKRFAAQHAIIRYGSEAIKPLIKSKETAKQYEVKNWLIWEIAEDSRIKFRQAPEKYLCKKCLTHFSRQRQKIPLVYDEGIYYYGCRICGQNRDYYENTHKITIRLDKNIFTAPLSPNTFNWYTGKKLFDFDRVEIINANDKDVEQFCIQVGNDTDEVRQPRYKEMTCVVQCKLDENTIRILENTFGEVKR